MTIEQGLLAALVAVVGALTWLVKAMNARSDKALEQRDREVGRLISALEKAVDNFAEFKEVLREIVDDLKTSSEIQASVLDELREMKERLPTRSE